MWYCFVELFEFIVNRVLTNFILFYVSGELKVTRGLGEVVFFRKFLSLFDTFLTIFQE